MEAQVYMRTSTRTHSCAFARTQARMYARSRTRTQACVHSFTRMCVRARVHACTHVHTFMSSMYMHACTPHARPPAHMHYTHHAYRIQHMHAPHYTHARTHTQHRLGEVAEVKGWVIFVPAAALLAGLVVCMRACMCMDVYVCACSCLYLSLCVH